ncbi:hypothetical protein ABIB57_003351 [Devosia sp. UYZn731]|uniref:hypothetical protein n=1 Tax=Devosia sp. UYZn731 TaxID=3156345 RepID=UPI0033983701
MRTSLFMIAVVAAFGAAVPAQAQDASMPLLRVYIDTPYFYDFLADVGAVDANGLYPVHVYLEGKEVGEANVLYNCAEHTWEQSPVVDWSGFSGDFLSAALLSFDHLYCGS